MLANFITFEMALFSFISNMLSGKSDASAHDPYLPREDEDTQYWLDAQLNGFSDDEDSPPNTGNSLYSNIEPINRWRHGNRILKSPRRLDETPTKGHYDVSSFKRVGNTLAKGRRRCSRCGHALMGHGMPVIGRDEIEKVLEAKAEKQVQSKTPKKTARVAKKPKKTKSRFEKEQEKWCKIVTLTDRPKIVGCGPRVLRSRTMT